MAAATDDKKETLREEFFKESFAMGQKSRWGMFSIPISTAIGDDTYYKPKPARRDAEGAVITAPRNFTTKNPKKGNIDSVLFSKPNYISIGDPYKPPGKVPMRDSKRDGFREGGHEVNFKPAKTVQRKVKADFQHMTDHREVSKCRKGPDGSVITEPRNFLTNPPKRGVIGKNTTFSGQIPHLPDPYERKREFEKKEREEHYKKLQEKPFSQKVRGRETFATIKETYGEDIPIPPKKPGEPRKPLMTHEVPFRPSNPPKRGYNKTLDRFPPYIEDPLRVVTRKKTTEGEDKGKWKPTHNKKTIPTPSVTTHFKNLKSEFPSVFRRL